MLLLSIIVAILAVGAYYVGIFDRPAYEFSESLVNRELYAIVATSTNKNIGGNVMRLLDGTEAGIKSLGNGGALLEAGAKAYGAPEGASSLAFGIYFDDPAKHESPRWAVGWILDSGSFGDVQGVVSAVAEASKLEESVKAVRIANVPVLKGTIPWRCRFTPWVAARFQWNRAFEKYRSGGYTSNAGREDGGPIAMEAYKVGKDDAYNSIDYVVLMGDTSVIWDDTFPSEKRETVTESTESQPEEPQVVQEAVAEEATTPESEPEQPVDEKPVDAEEGVANEPVESETVNAKEDSKSETVEEAVPQEVAREAVEEPLSEPDAEETDSRDSEEDEDDEENMFLAPDSDDDEDDEDSDDSEDDE